MSLQNNKVAIKSIKKARIELSRPLLLELKRVSITYVFLPSFPIAYVPNLIILLSYLQLIIKLQTNDTFSK